MKPTDIALPPGGADELLAKVNEFRQDSTDLETVSRLLSGIGIEVLGNSDAQQWPEEPFLCGQITQAKVTIQEEEGQERCVFVIEVLGPNGPRSVYCNSNLCIKIFPKMGSGTLQWNQWKDRTDPMHPERGAFIAWVNSEAKTLHGAGLSIQYRGKVASKNAGREYRDFLVSWIPGELFEQLGAEMVASLVAPGKDGREAFDYYHSEPVIDGDL